MAVSLKALQQLCHARVPLHEKCGADSSNICKHYTHHEHRTHKWCVQCGACRKTTLASAWQSRPTHQGQQSLSPCCMTSKLRTFHTAICSARAGTVSIMFTRSLWSHCTRTCRCGSTGTCTTVSTHGSGTLQLHPSRTGA